MSNTKTAYMNIRLTPALKSKLKRRAAISKRSLINEVLFTLEQGIAREERAKKATA
jgi:plasmid stability protein